MKLSHVRLLVDGGPQSRTDWRIRVVYVRDPAGHLLELDQPLADR